MREKIYSKFTKERQRQFQIETGIWEDDGIRYVEKRALHEEGKVHIRNMYRNYRKLKKKHPYLAPCEIRNEDVLVFSYLQGTSMSNRLLGIVEGKDREGLIQEIKSFREFIIETAWEQGMPESPGGLEDSRGLSNPLELDHPLGLESIFGNAGESLQGGEAVILGNLDLTFDNVIENKEGRFVIDYEWIMPFAVPVDFILYRAVYGFFQKFHENIRYLISREELLITLGIGPQRYVLFEEMDRSFNRYVFGAEGGYQAILKQYERRTYDFKEVFENDGEWAQVFFDKGEGYREESSVLIPVKRGTGIQHIRVPLHEVTKLKSIRFDPAIEASVIKIEDIILHTKDGKMIPVSKIKANTGMIQDNTYVFLKEDPQMIFDIKKNKLLGELEIRYRILQVINPVK